MNDKVKKYREAWIVALRSGKYQQAREHLQTADGYCCLGVACEVLNRLGISVDIKRAMNRDLILEGSTLSDHQKQIFNALRLSVGGEMLLIKYNDREKLTFHQIAARLISRPKLFFRSASGTCNE